MRSPAVPLSSLVLDMTPAPHGADPDGAVPPPLWEPLPVQPGRGLVCPYTGRLLSPQQMVLESEADETLFGGAPGGAKSYLVLGLAATQHLNSVVFRREYTQFRGEGGLFAKLREMIGLRGGVRESPMSGWTDEGRFVEFGAVKTQSDLAKWMGRPHDLKAFDELPEIPESFYRFLVGWMRTDVVGQRVRAIGTGNPPVTQDAMWVNRYWGPWLDPKHPRPAVPGELRWYFVDRDGRDVERPDGEPFLFQGVQDAAPRMVTPRSRTFVPASVEDNPHYMQTGYARQLDNLPEPLRSAYRFGRFDATIEDHAWQIIPTAWVRAAQERWTKDGRGTQPLSQVGNDPSRGGTDEFVVASRYGSWVGPLDVTPAKAVPDGPAGAAVLARVLAGDRETPVLVDIIGSAGSSVYDHARGLGLNAVALNGSQRSEAKDKSGKLGFHNVRAEIHWRMRELLDPANGYDMALPPDPQLLSDLTAPRWQPCPKGIQVEDKEAIKARLGRSPDRGEAVIYACTRPKSAGPKAVARVTW
jgi:hypothetical protein